jgi:hypothetical protein
MFGLRKKKKKAITGYIDAEITTGARIPAKW